MSDGAPKRKIITKKFYGFNIKIQSNRDIDEVVFSSLIKELYDGRIGKKVSNDKVVILRTQFKTEKTFNGTTHDIYYGKMARYTLIEGSQWFNERTMELENPSFPSGIHPSGFEGDYIFIPAVHRFFLEVQQKVTVTMALEFLKLAFGQIIKPGEICIVSLMQEQNVIDSIINAPAIKSLRVKVSYTNDDVGDKAQEALDKILKGANVGKIDATLKAPPQGSIDSSKEFIRGLIELSKDNGGSRARIINISGKREIIDTSEYPEKLKITLDDKQDERGKLFSLIMERLRNGARRNR